MVDENAAEEVGEGERVGDGFEDVKELKRVDRHVDEGEYVCRCGVDACVKTDR